MNHILFVMINIILFSIFKQFYNSKYQYRYVILCISATLITLTLHQNKDIIKNNNMLDFMLDSFLYDE
jgi:hypothetical protein